jgi:hypothetical protein
MSPVLFLFKLLLAEYSQYTFHVANDKEDL